MLRQNIFANHARSYIDLGWQIFPTTPGTKFPLRGSGGVKDASGNKAQIDVWRAQHPHANVALKCGEDSGVIAIDIDVRSGGFETLAKLAKLGKVLPPAVESRTPTGGTHLFFQYDDRVSVSGSNKLGPGVDVITNGHACTLPPSCNLKAGGNYKWIRAPLGKHLPALPHWVIQACQPKPEPKVRKPNLDYGRLQGYARQAMADLERAVRKASQLTDGRHQEPFRLAAALGRYVHHGALAAQTLEDAIVTACLSNGALKKYRLADIRAQVRNGLRRAAGDTLPRLSRAHRA